MDKAAAPSHCVVLNGTNNVPVSFQLPPELKKKAEEELQEKEEWRDRDIAALRELVKGIDCFFLLMFLFVLRRACYDLSCVLG